jgi:hypothetical protein
VILSIYAPTGWNASPFASHLRRHDNLVRRDVPISATMSELRKPFGSATAELFTFRPYGDAHSPRGQQRAPATASSTIRCDIGLGASAPTRLRCDLLSRLALHNIRRRPSCNAATATSRRRSMRKALPQDMFTQPENSRITVLRSWVLDHGVTEIEMKERQFWNFAALQPVSEKPWATFMGRTINVPDMPEDAQKQIGVFNRKGAGMI